MLPPSHRLFSAQAVGVHLPVHMPWLAVGSWASRPSHVQPKAAQPASHLLFWPLQVLGLWAPPVATVPGRSSPVPALVRLRRRLRSQTGRLSRPVVHLGQDTVAQGFPLPLSCVLSYKLKCIAEHPIQQLSQRCDSVHRQSHTMCAAVSITVKGVGSRFSAGTKKRREITVVVASTVITS